MTAAPVRVYLLDIEGTVAPLTLTAEVLFPYARAHVEEFLRRHGGDPDVQADLALLAEENRAETDPSCPKIEGAPGPFVGTGDSDVLPYLFWLMDRDRKSTALKSLQGKIWKIGFKSGELKGMFFPDVPPALERWSKDSKVAIYSSGSVEAQRLLFGRSTVGDLTPLLSGYFDTRIGPKTASASYAAIAKAIGVAPGEILFFSDVVRELDAAREAGCQTLLVVRPGNPPAAHAHGHRVIESFDSI
jgi:enolase-phosphatase E1